MAGILANSATQTMVSGDTAADKSVTGYLLGEQITLSVTGSVSAFSWGQTVPTGSTPARSALSTETGATPRFTPDVSGYYVVTCNADGTDYVIRIAVLDVVSAVAREALRFLPRADAQVPAPSSGIALYCDTAEDMRYKDSAGTGYLLARQVEENSGTVADSGTLTDSITLDAGYSYTMSLEAFAEDGSLGLTFAAYRSVIAYRPTGGSATILADEAGISNFPAQWSLAASQSGNTVVATLSNTSGTDRGGKVAIIVDRKVAIPTAP